MHTGGLRTQQQQGPTPPHGALGPAQAGVPEFKPPNQGPQHYFPPPRMQLAAAAQQIPAFTPNLNHFPAPAAGQGVGWETVQIGMLSRRVDELEDIVRTLTGAKEECREALQRRDNDVAALQHDVQAERLAAGVAREEAERWATGEWIARDQRRQAEQSAAQSESARRAADDRLQLLKIVVQELENRLRIVYAESTAATNIQSAGSEAILAQTRAQVEQLQQVVNSAQQSLQEEQAMRKAERAKFQKTLNDVESARDQAVAKTEEMQLKLNRLQEAPLQDLPACTVPPLTHSERLALMAYGVTDPDEWHERQYRLTHPRGAGVEGRCGGDEDTGPLQCSASQAAADDDVLLETKGMP
eukprot:TRINITY_DN21330_c0_g1_i1.p1 TRINITY_DN21330_c0_g1~~TRINITY_DN21330_c0_g1_i1.p1  ORF type:complete len:381 (+),score=102.32 TRINITY_DN21330_c0_g1_i1:73-1143(+)